MARRVVGLAVGAAGSAAVLGVALLAGPTFGSGAGPDPTPDLARDRTQDVPALLMADDLRLVLAADGSDGLDGTDAADGSTDADGVPVGRPRDRLTHRLERACDRIPDAVERLGRLEDRLAAGAETHGSVRWLETKVDAARDAGLEDLETALEARLEVRRQAQQLLPARVDMLRKARTGICTDVDAALEVLS